MRRRYVQFPELHAEHERDYWRVRTACASCFKRYSRRSVCWTIKGRTGLHCGKCAKAANLQLF